MLLRVFVCIVIATGALRAQNPPPAQPFQAVHLLWVDVQQPNAEASVRSAIAAMNQAITRAGCPECTYHLWRVVDAAQGGYRYVQVSHWPSGAVYTKIHNSPDYIAASQNWQNLRLVVTKEVYNRYVEVQPGKEDSTKANLD